MLEASTTAAPELVANMNNILGPRLTSFIVGVKDPRTLANWQRSGDVPFDAARRLQAAWAAALTLEPMYGHEQVASWFTWLNDALDDASPAAYLRSADDDDQIESRGREVLAAARLHVNVE
jgi:hypothetical protein